MKQRILILALTALSMLCATPMLPDANPLRAQYAISRSVFGLGGSETKNTQNRVIGTLGQPLIGVTQNAGTVHRAGFWYGVKSIPVDVAAVASMPHAVWLGRSAPHPVRGLAAVPFTISAGSFVRLSVMNMLGEEVRILTESMLPPGKYSVPFDAAGLPTGLYFLRLHAGREIATSSFIVRH
jgi:hypothetical protein